MKILSHLIFVHRPLLDPAVVLLLMHHCFARNVTKSRTVNGEMIDIWLKGISSAKFIFEHVDGIFEICKR